MAVRSWRSVITMAGLLLCGCTPQPRRTPSMDEFRPDSLSFVIDNFGVFPKLPGRAHSDAPSESWRREVAPGTSRHLRALSLELPLRFVDDGIRGDLSDAKGSSGSSMGGWRVPHPSASTPRAWGAGHVMLFMGEEGY